MGIKIIVFVWFICFFYNTDSSASETYFIIGFPEDNLANDWRAAQMNEIERALSQHQNVRFLKADAQGSVAKNILDIEAMVAKGAQLLFLGPKNPDAVAVIAARLRQQGIYIVLLTRTLNTDDFDVYISPNDFRIGLEAAVFLGEHMQGKGRILMLEGIPTTTTAINRKNGFMQGLQSFPAIETVSRVANYKRAEAILSVENALLDGIQFDAIYAHNDAMAAGARLALKKANINPAAIPTVGIDYLPETRTAIIRGEQLASFTYPTCGKAGVKAALELLNGRVVERHIEVPSQLVTKANVANVDTVY